MGKENHRKTWQQPWSYREGTLVTAIILLLGFGIQLVTGGTILLMAGFPWNLISGLLFLCLMICCFVFFKKHTLIKGLGSVKAALPAILGFTFLVLLMGFVKQDAQSSNQLVQLLGLNHLVKTWPFILINFYLLILLGIVTLKRLTPFNLKNGGFFLNHFGLFLVLFSTALGSSDIQRLTLNCYEGKPASEAIDESQRVVELPFSVQLLDFTIEEFRPKIMLVDNKTSQVVKDKGKNRIEIMDRDSFDLAPYHIQVVQFLESSIKTSDSYISRNEPGDGPSAMLKVINKTDHSEISGWISSGSFAFQPEVLKINEDHSLVMLPAEAKKFSSGLSILDKRGKKVITTIEVNKPFHFDGWSIYQLGYDTEMGRWSELSVLQLVRDPWLPVVYLGIFLMMAGAAFLFVTGKPKNGGTEHVD
jgi:hypothetical protein